MPTHSNRNSIPKPLNIEATRETRSSLKISLVNLVLVTSYTKNHAVKNTPIPKRIIVKLGNTAGLIGETYLDMDSIAIWAVMFTIIFW